MQQMITNTVIFYLFLTVVLHLHFRDGEIILESDHVIFEIRTFRDCF